MKDGDALDFVQPAAIDEPTVSLEEATVSIDTGKSAGSNRFRKPRRLGMPPLALSPSTSDAQLLKEFTDRDSEQAFAMLMQRYRPMVVATAIRRGLNRALAEDASQEVFSILAEKAGSLVSRASIAGWLHRATIFEASRMLQAEVRRHSRNIEWTSMVAGRRLPPSTSVDETLRLLDEALDELTAGDREILLLHYFQELPYATIAARLRVNEVAVRQRVNRALGRLESRLESKGVRAGAAAALLAAAAMQHGTAAVTGVVALLAAGSTGATLWNALVGTLASSSFKALGVVTVAIAAAATIGNQIRKPSDLPTPTSELRVSADPKASMSSQQLDGTVDRNPSDSLMRVPRLQGVSAVSATQAGSAKKAASPSSRTTGGTSQASNSKRTTPGGRDNRPVSDPPAEIGPFGQVSTAPVDIPQGSDSGEVLAGLQTIELIPEEAAKFYTNLLSDLLNLTPDEGGLIGGLLKNHFEALNTAGVAGTPVSDTVLSTWRAVRVPLTESVVAEVSDVLTEISPELGASGVTETVKEVLMLPDKLVSETIPPVESAVTDVISETTEPLIEGVKKVLPVKLPLLR